MASIKLKMYKRDVRKDGSCGIYLQVIINRRKLDLGLDLKWPVDRFNEIGGCKPRFKGDKLAGDYNLIIGNARTRANNILVYYRVRELPIDIDLFKREYHSNMNKSNFIEYFEQKSFERWNKGIISDVTYKQEKSTLKKLKVFVVKKTKLTVLPFNSFHAQWGQEWDLFLQSEYGNDQNTRWGERKRVKTYLSIATQDGIAFIDPFKKFKVGQKKSRFKALTKTEFQKLWAHYKKPGIDIVKKAILRRFLFSCCTGLRISDLRSLTVENFKGDNMTISPKKTKRFGTKIDEVPLSDMAVILLTEEREFSTDGRLFFKYTEQYGNRALKQICTDAGLDRGVKNHEGRSTFASLYDQAGGNHRSLLELMGLTKMETLIKYVHTNKEVIQEGVDKMNQLINLENQNTNP